MNGVERAACFAIAVVFLLPVSALLTLSSIELTLPTTVYSEEDLSDIGYGWPVEFLIADMDTSTLGPFPFQVNSVPTLNDPWKILWPRFSLDVIFFFVLLFGAGVLCVRLVPAQRWRTMSSASSSP